MKIFQTFLRNFKWLDIGADRMSFGVNDFKHMLAFMFGIMSLCIYLSNEATTAKQQMKTMTLIGVIILLLINYLSYKFYSKQISNLIVELEQNINKSK